MCVCDQRLGAGVADVVVGAARPQHLPRELPRCDGGVSQGTHVGAVVLGDLYQVGLGEPHIFTRVFDLFFFLKQKSSLLNERKHPPKVKRNLVMHSSGCLTWSWMLHSSFHTSSRKKPETCVCVYVCVLTSVYVC